MPEVCPSLSRVPVVQKSHLKTERTDRVASLTWLKNLVDICIWTLMMCSISHVFCKTPLDFIFTGDYEVSIKFNDEHIPDSPYLVPVCAAVDDARRLTVTSLQVRHEKTSPHGMHVHSYQHTAFTTDRSNLRANVFKCYEFIEDRVCRL